MKKINIYLFAFVLFTFSMFSVAASAQNVSEKAIKVEKKKSLNGFEIQFDGMSEDAEEALHMAIDKWLDTQKIKYKEKKEIITQQK